MKWTYLIFAILLFACHQVQNKIAEKRSSKNESLKINRDSLKLLSKQKEQADSIKQDSAITKILNYALLYIDKPYFKKQLKSCDPLLATDIIFGNLFAHDKKHLVVKNYINLYEVHLSVFVFDGVKFKLVLNQAFSQLTFLDDKIKDVNGDYQKDLLIHWYPLSGCCRRDMYDVYLYQKNNGDFTKKYRFINPTFYPTEKIIRGVGYGQPGDAELYKYKWNGLKVDTVELILPDTLSGKFHVFQHWKDFDNSKVGRFLTDVPKEYSKIESYDWFKGVY